MDEGDLVDQDRQIITDGSDPDRESRRDLSLVMIGASAGGLEALVNFFDNLDMPCGWAIVIVQHLSPDHKSLMPELLGRHTVLDVIQISDDIDLSPDRIFLCPSGYELRIEGEKLALTQSKKTGPKMPIDSAFSAASNLSFHNVVGVVLSGSGSDGARGCMSIKDNGGLVFVQNPDDAKFPSMPNSAIETGSVDVIADAADLPREIKRQLQRKYAAQSPVISRFSEPFERVLVKIRDYTGVDFLGYKRSTLYRRIDKFRLSIGSELSFEELEVRIDREPSLAQSLLDECLISVTEFFRDKEYYESLEQVILPQVLANREVGEPLRIWVPGCATGEEAYSIAMTLISVCEASKYRVDIKIFATDIHSRAIEHANLGLYRTEDVEAVPANFRNRFFVEHSGQWRIDDAVRRVVIFARHDITMDPPFSRIDLISCRNLLIYMDPPLQRRVLSMLHFSLRPDGVLVLGKSESVGPAGGVFERIHRDLQVFKPIGRVRMNHTSFAVRPPVGPFLTSRGAANRPPKSVSDSLGSEAIVQAVLSCLAPKTWCVIGASGDVIYSSGQPEEYFKVQSGWATTNLFSLLEGEIAAAVSASVSHAWAKESVVVCHGLSFFQQDEDSDPKVIDIRVHPVLATKEREQLVIVEFVPVTAESPRELGTQEQVVTGQVGEEHLNFMQTNHVEMAELQRELFAMRMSLKTTVEERETANEELQAANEELLSSNEELQSTNEELQSLNEELHTVNAELQQKVRELTILTDDLQNLFRNVEFGILFLDLELKVRKFNPAVREFVNLVEHDVGRPLSHISDNFVGGNLLRAAEQVLDNLTPKEVEMRTQADGIVLTRIVPYRSGGFSVSGVLITLTDITEQISVVARTEALTAAFDKSMTYFAVINASGTITHTNEGLAYALAYGLRDLVGTPASSVFVTEPPRSDGMANVLEYVARYRHWNGRLGLITKHEKSQLVEAILVGGFSNDKLVQIVLAAEPVRQDTVVVDERSEKIMQEHLSRLALAGYWEWRPTVERGFCTSEVRNMLGIPAINPIPLESFLQHVEGEDRRLLELGLNRAVVEGKGYNIEFGVKIPGRNHSTRLLARGGASIRRSESTEFVSGIVQDITQIMSHYAHVSDSHVAVLDVDGNILFASENLSRLIKSRAQRNSIAHWFNDCVLKHDTDRWRVWLDEVSTLGASARPLSAGIRHGETVSYWHAIRLINDAPGTPVIAILGNVDKPRELIDPFE